MGKFSEELVKSLRVLYLINLYKNKCLSVDAVSEDDYATVGRPHWKSTSPRPWENAAGQYYSFQGCLQLCHGGELRGQSVTDCVLFFFLVPSIACTILVSWPGIEPGPGIKAPSPNHWTAREFPRDQILSLLPNKYVLWVIVRLVGKCVLFYKKPFEENHSFSEELCSFIAFKLRNLILIRNRKVTAEVAC